EFINLEDEALKQWWDENRYQLTFYSRAPEFNAFGRPRLTATRVPLTLEGGPNYQMPFVYNASGDQTKTPMVNGVLHMNSLFGSLAYNGKVSANPEGWWRNRISGANLINRAQIEMLRRYLARPFPGYETSFAEKHGDIESAQVALNIMSMARNATTSPRRHYRNRWADVNWHSSHLAGVSNSLLDAPPTFYKRFNRPERNFWRFDPEPNGEGKFLNYLEKDTDDTLLMIPSSPGPHITEVRLVMQRGRVHSSDPTLRGVRFRFEVEYLHQDFASVTSLHYSPFMVDYFEMKLKGEDVRHTQRLSHRDWSYNKHKRVPSHIDIHGRQRYKWPVNRLHLGGLAVRAPRHSWIGDADSDWKHRRRDIKDRVLVRGPWREIGKRSFWLANHAANDP
ncbi:MAG: hypothetical protein AAF226_18755, partial [Verrucomicrobiota bacterium]